jgi:glycosyltransferase involved in cell wall biosynthesis
MKILHVTPSFHPAYIYGGTTRSVYDLCRNLARGGCEVKVLTTDANGPDAVLEVDTDREVPIEDGIIVRYCHRIIDVSVSPSLLRLLPSYLRWADVVHLMAVYSFPTIPTLLACKMMRKPVVWSPRGMLQRWEGSTRTGLKSIWNRACRIASPRRLVLHATSEEEARESRQRMPGVNTVVIPNSVELPEGVTHTPQNGKLRMLCLGRLDPKKGIENLLAACKILEGPPRIDLSLTIAGAGDEGYTRGITSQIEQLGLTHQVKTVGAVLGDAKRALFEGADVAVFPSYTENFGMVVAEALAHGVPVIASKGTPWSRVEDTKCGLWVDNSPESLANAIRQIGSMPMAEMGLRGREMIGREYCGEQVAKRMIDVYRGLCSGLP